MSTVQMTKENFQETIDGNDVVVVDFWAQWCGPCLQFAPIFEKTSEKYPDIVFAKVNTEEQPELAGAFQIQAIPTLMVFREQVLVYADAGALPAHALRGLIDQVMELDMEDVKKKAKEMSA